MSDYIDGGNFASYILRHADTQPDALALVIPTRWDGDSGEIHEERVTYLGFAERTRELMVGFQRLGLTAGDRVIVLFPLSVDLYATVVALWALGAAVVFIDTGMPPQKIKQAMETANAKAIVSIHKLLKYRFLLWPLFKIKHKITREQPGFLLKPFSVLEGGDPSVAPSTVARDAQDEALISFTSGSTGRPKGANRTHGLLTEQHIALKNEYPPKEGQVDMTCFPVVALHNLCCGTTTVMPAVDLANPAGVDPRLIVKQLGEYQVNTLTGAPAFVGRVVDEVLSQGLSFPGLWQLGCGGAPVTLELCQKVLKAFPETDSQVIYGSTEAEPMAHASMQDAVTIKGNGYMAGKLAKCTTMELVNLPKELPNIEQGGLAEYRVARGGIGEICVSGPHVNPGYIDNPAANRETKIFEPDGKVWHRTGDLGYFDDEERLWLVGRVKDRIKYGDRMMDPFPVEVHLEANASIARTVVMDGDSFPHGILLVQPVADAESDNAIAASKEVLQQYDCGEMIITLVRAIPVDARHNSKVDRPKLREALASSYKGPDQWLGDA